MTLSNSALVSRFYNGGESGASNNMSIEGRSNGESVLWGYDWAIYAFRIPTGTVYKFTGWNHYSQTTTSHMSLISGAKVTEIDAQPESISEVKDAISEKQKVTA